MDNYINLLNGRLSLTSRHVQSGTKHLHLYFYITVSIHHSFVSNSLHVFYGNYRCINYLYNKFQWWFLLFTEWLTTKSVYMKALPNFFFHVTLFIILYSATSTGGYNGLDNVHQGACLYKNMRLKIRVCCASTSSKFYFADNLHTICIITISHDQNVEMPACDFVLIA